MMDLVILVVSIIWRWASSVQGGIPGMPSGNSWPFSMLAVRYPGGTKWECVSIFS